MRQKWVGVLEGEGTGCGGRGSPAVRMVFLMDSIIRLLPEACRRTLVRSNRLVAAKKGEAIEAWDTGRDVRCLLRYRCGDTYRMKMVSAICVTRTSMLRAMRRKGRKVVPPSQKG
jgi:hypothetical protein